MRKQAHRIERSQAIAPDDIVPHREIFYKKAKLVKIHGTLIVSSKTTNR
jgi:hypothetical protein